MKLEIYHEEKETVVEEPVRLALDVRGNGIAVIAVDKYGKRVTCGDLVFISTDGNIKKFPSVHPNLGFQLDARGKIKEQE